MNPEPDSAADNEAPQDAPAAVSAAAPLPAAAETAATLPADAADAADATGAVPAPLREASAESPAPVPAANAEPSTLAAADGVPSDATPPVASAPAPDLSPAATGARLAELFPALFVGPDGKGTWKPIKLRIHADIQARAPGQFSKRTLGIFFSRYTTTTPYLKALAAPGAQRCDLDGQPAGEIAEEHRSAAAEEVARRQAIAAERRAAFRPPRREAPPADASNLPAGGSREGDPDRRAGPPPERPPEDHPAGRVPRRPQEGGQRTARRQQPGPDAPPSPRAARPARPPRQVDGSPHATRRVGPVVAERAPPMQRVEPPAALPVDPAQRERAMLLRSYESSPLSKANFCALKGMTEAALDAALAQAQAERGALPNAPAQRRSGR